MKPITKATIAILLLLALCITIAVLSGSETHPRVDYFPDHSQIDVDSLHDAQIEADQKALQDRASHESEGRKR